MRENNDMFYGVRFKSFTTLNSLFCFTNSTIRSTCSSFFIISPRDFFNNPKESGVAMRVVVNRSLPSLIRMVEL